MSCFLFCQWQDYYKIYFYNPISYEKNLEFTFNNYNENRKIIICDINLLKSKIFVLRYYT